MGTGVGQVGASAYHGNMDAPTHQSLGNPLATHCQGYDKG